MEKLTQIFTVIKYQENVLNLFFLSVILIDSVFRTGKNYYPQVFLEQFKSVVKEKKIPKYIIDDTEISSDSDRENPARKNSDSDRENSDKENSAWIKYFFIHFFCLYKNGK